MSPFNAPHFVSYPVRFTAARWGAGAEIGKTHVYTHQGESLQPFMRGLWPSFQCVTDDFGNLVPVEDKK